MYTRKTPSGRWKCQYRVDGKYKCVTADTKEEAELLAREDQVRGKAKKALGPTVGEAVRRYIDSRDAVLSPATVAGYEKILRNYLGNIQDTPLSRLSQLDYQTFVNALSRKKNRRGVIMSPKSIANICGLIEAAARECGVTLTAKRPAPRKRIVSLMPPEAVISLVSGSDIELPVLLAMWLSLSLSEIRGLTVASVHDGLLTVKGSVVDIDGVPTWKESNKAYDRSRTLRIPEPIMLLIEKTDAWKKGEGYLVPMTGQAIYKRWIRLQDTTHQMTFHQLRHLNASIMMALGLPDTYAMERGGWSSRQTLNRVYQHTMASRRSEYDDRVDAFFRSCLLTDASGV
jgi:integrase